MRNEPNMADYDKFYEEFEWQVPKYYNFGWDVIHERASDKTKLALITVGEDGTEATELTFWDLDRLSNALANSLLDMGIQKGDRVFLMLPRSEEWYISMIALIKIGAIAMPTPTLAAGHDIDYRINRAEAKVAITDSGGARKVDEVQDDLPTLKYKIITGSEKKGWLSFDYMITDSSKELDPNVVNKTLSNDPMLVYFTSGTTGNPKMVRHNHSYPLGHEVTARYCQDLRSTDIIWAIADTGWAKTAWGKLFGQWIVGATVLQWEMRSRFDPRVVLNILQNWGVSVFCAPPTAYRMMVKECDLKDWDFSQLRHSMSAGEPLNPEIIRIWSEHTGQGIYDYYGQTESVALIANYRCMPIRPGSMGKPTPGHEIEIVDDQGNVVPDGEEGHIAVRVRPERPPGIFAGYWKDEEKTSEVFKGDWYYTGDKAYKDEDGYFWFVGRADDVIKASGYRIGPFEVESALQEHPAVKESAVIGVPDETRGQVVKAFVILSSGHEPSEGMVKELQEHVKSVTAPYKYPRVIEFVDELPKTISGKIKRKQLRIMETSKKEEISGST